MSLPQRIPILYLILGVLVLVAVVPMYFYSKQVVSDSRGRLKTNEQLLQNTVTRSLADDISQRQRNLSSMLDNLATAINVASGGNLKGENVNSPELRALLERFVSSSGQVLYATLVNGESKGINAGVITPDVFMHRELEHSFAAAQDSRPYTGQALTLSEGKKNYTTMLVAQPLLANNNFIGMIAAAVDLQYVIDRLQDGAQGGLTPFVVDRHGRLIAAAPVLKYSTGQDLGNVELVRAFKAQDSKSHFVPTMEFTMDQGGEPVEMLGTYSPVSSLDWAVVAIKPQREAYREVIEMQRTAIMLAVVAVFVSIIISIFAAKRITQPLQTLTESSRAIARGDFSQRVHVKSRTEIGELALTFNHMTDDLERFVQDLKNAAEENRSLFLGSIQMLAGAVDEKDPYTRGHSDRVTRYCVILAKELGLSEEEIEKVRISAQLHDVGKIGIEDRILKKPGALTPDEFEIMKTHTTKGAAILRPVAQLKDMIPGIELHHESLDGRGYPYGLKGDEIPLIPRIIMVSDTFDAMTTNRPYQAAMEAEYVIRIINSLANTKFDPKVVAAMTSVYEKGLLRLHRAATVNPETAAVAAAAAAEAPAVPDVRF